MLQKVGDVLVIGGSEGCDNGAHLPRRSHVGFSDRLEECGKGTGRWIYTAVLDVKRSTAEHLHLLHDHRIVARNRKGRRALGCFKQAV